MDTTYIYALVAAAIILPVLLWKREESKPVRDYVQGRWENLPQSFKSMWPAVLLLEPTIGAAVAKFGAGGREQFEKLRDASGLPLTYERLCVMKVVCTVLLALPGLAFLAIPNFEVSYALAILAVFVVFGWVYPLMTLKQYVEWRKTELSRALPFAIDLMASAMKSGLEFGASMRYYVGLGTGGPLQEEFSSVLRQIELGKTRAEALADMARRVQIDAFTSFVGVIAYGTEIGASIVDTLKVQGENLRRERFNIAERKAARAPSLMILPLAVFIMPAVFIIIITPVVMQMKATGLGAH